MEELVKRPFNAAMAEYILALAWNDCTNPMCDCAKAKDPDTWYEAMTSLMRERAPA